MDNLLLWAFVFWPGVLIVAALLNMLTSWTFSWSELIFDYLIGMAIGLCFWFGTQPDAGVVQRIFLLLSQGLFGALHWAGLDAFADRVTMFIWSASFIGGSVLLSGLLDRATLAIDHKMSVGGGLLSILILALKLPYSLVTTAIGILIGIVGMIIGAANGHGKVGFLGGTLYVEFDTSSASSSATTLGATIMCWKGNLSTIIDHEFYHTRQYIYMHDWLTPAWVIGGLWGWVSSAIAGTFAVCFFSTARHDKEVGNPLERAAYRISGYSNCP